MVEVIELSLQETNKLRAQLGLPQITPKKPNPNEGRTDLSLEETNKLRAELGLKPIPSTQNVKVDAAPTPTPQPLANDEAKDYDAVQSRVLKARQTSAKRKLQLDYDNDDDWLANLGKPVAKKGRITSKKVSDRDESIVVNHSTQELASMGDRAILTMGNDDLVDSDEEVALQNESVVRNNVATPSSTEGGHHTTFGVSGVRVVNDDNTETQPEAHKSYSLAELLEDDATSAVHKDIKSSKIKKRKKHKTENVKVTRLDDDVNFAAPKLLSTADFHDSYDDEFEATLARSRRVKQKPVDLELKTEEHRVWDATAEVDIAIATVTFDDTKFLSDLRPEESNAQRDADDDADNESNGNSAKTEPTPDTNSTGNNQMSGSFHSVGSVMSHLRAQKVIDGVSEERKAAARRMRSAQQQAHKLRLEVDIEKRMLREELATDKSYMAMSTEAKEEHYEKLLALRLHQKQLIAPKTLLSTDTRAYNPVVKIQHVDDQGNELSTKQAYKHQARIFHGTGTRKQASRRGK